MDVKEIFKIYEDEEYIKFDRINNPPSKRPDICAFLLLDRLCPGKRDMVAAAEHDEIFLDVSPEELSNVASEEDILYLTRCGVRYNEEVEGLAMFV